ncbi:N-acetylmuramate alpha-1-phosphate uridylyltransferase MurU [Alkanindiges sp. WGS2144]|uniref:N-acetylmuramate alpha-1-phosphate uridylyltransferase MurU n=1 Tax=Alkanindiges sp. WGS2144 TaxID=3366808 RepID=UPI003752B4D4
MKAMILAAGLGTRMRPLTLDTPKPLLCVGGKPLIVWHIEALKKAGITEIVINCAWLADKLMNALGNGSQYGVNIHWSVEAEALETAGGIVQALAVLGTAPFVLVNGDVWTRFDYSCLSSYSLNDDLAHLILVDNPPQHPKGDFVLADGRIYVDHVDVPPEQQQAVEKLTFSGLSVLSPRLFANLPAGKRPLAPLLREAMQKGQVSGAKLDAAWVDVGTPERLAQLDAQIRSQKI